MEVVAAVVLLLRLLLLLLLACLVLARLLPELLGRVRVRMHGWTCG